MTFTFDAEFERDSVIQLIDDIEKCKSNNITIYFSSTGGIVSYAELLIDYINRQKKNILLIAYYFIESCAFDFFIKAKCKKEIKDTCITMVHLSKPIIDGKMITKIGRKKHPQHIEFFNQIDSTNKGYCEFYRKIGLPEDYMKKIEKGEDVKIPVDLMRKIIKRE